MSQYRLMYFLYQVLFCHDVSSHKVIMLDMVRKLWQFSIWVFGHDYTSLSNLQVCNNLSFQHHVYKNSWIYILLHDTTHSEENLEFPFKALYRISMYMCIYIPCTSHLNSLWLAKPKTTYEIHFPILSHSLA